MTKFRARIARTGLQTYDHGAEQRDADEVFAAASLATLNGVKVQVSHDANAPAVGHVEPGSAGRVEGTDGHSYLTAVLVITDAATVARIRSGELRHISCGYDAEGTYDSAGLRHQTNIRFEHVALLRRDREQPRCGTGCAIGDDMSTNRTSDAITFDGNCGCDRQDDVRVDAQTLTIHARAAADMADETLRKSGDYLRTDALAATAGVPFNTAQAWRSGLVVPREDHDRLRTAAVELARRADAKTNGTPAYPLNLTPHVDANSYDAFANRLDSRFQRPGSDAHKASASGGK